MTSVEALMAADTLRDWPHYFGPLDCAGTYEVLAGGLTEAKRDYRDARVRHDHDRAAAVLDEIIDLAWLLGALAEGVRAQRARFLASDRPWPLMFRFSQNTGLTSRPVSAGQSDTCSNHAVGVQRPAWWFYPERCANGHEWGPGLILVSWERCHCAPARAAHPKRAAWGHLTVACRVPGRRSVWYSPRHEPGPHQSFTRALAIQALRRLTGRRTVVFVGGLLSAAAQQHVPASGSLISNHELWLGVLIGIGAAIILPAWLTYLLAGFAFLLSGLLPAVRHHAHSPSMTYLVVGVAALVAGLFFGRRRGLRQLGEAEYRTRFRNVRGVSRFL